jgi:hypothetical protein
MITERVQIMFHLRCSQTLTLDIGNSYLFCTDALEKRWMQTRLRVERYRENKKMKPTHPIARTLFGDFTNIQMSCIIDCFLLLFNKLFHEYPLSF